MSQLFIFPDEHLPSPPTHPPLIHFCQYIRRRCLVPLTQFLVAQLPTGYCSLALAHVMFLFI